MQVDGIRDARRVARDLLYRFGITAPEHVRIEAIAKRLGVRIVETRLDGAQAQLVQNGRDAIIYVSDRITDPCARRFCVAHELGHFVLKHPATPASQLCKPHAWKQLGDVLERDLEREANVFASEILMPCSLVEKRCDVSPVDLGVPREIARDFTVSILASTRRFAELSPERCIAVFSANGVVQWRHPSPTFTRDVAPGKRLDRDSAAWDFFARGALDDRPQPIPASAWLETSVDVDIVEHSICSHEHQTVLSLLWVPERVADPLGMIV
ncbi:MAG TPA: ImmA/IrrE family metallo-endopeptidase [Kofleriaceae bacterium]|jgi:Zn-dependent peptidase ImmA (M78 family)